MDNILIVHEHITPKEIQSGDISGFLGRWNTQRYSPPLLKRMMGALYMSVDGYDNDPREIFVIPEVKNHIKKLNEAWPYLFYFHETQIGAIMPFTMCCLSTLRLISDDKERLYKVRYDIGEMTNFVDEKFRHMHELCEKAQIPPEVEAIRQNEILQCLMR